MQIQIFFKVFLISLCLSLIVFAFGDIGLGTLAKILAIGVVISIAIGALYPQIRGVHNGDMVSATSHPNLPALMGRFGKALSGGKINSQIKVKFENGEEAIAIIEKYGGLLSPPKVRIVYEEKLIE